MRGGEKKLMDHLNYLEAIGITVSEWERLTNAIAQDLVDILRQKECSYYDAKMAISKANSFLEQAMLKTKI